MRVIYLRDRCDCGGSWICVLSYSWPRPPPAAIRWPKKWRPPKSERDCRRPATASSGNCTSSCWWRRSSPPSTAPDIAKRKPTISLSHRNPTANTIRYSMKQPQIRAYKNMHASGTRIRKSVPGKSIVNKAVKTCLISSFSCLFSTTIVSILHCIPMFRDLLCISIDTFNDHSKKHFSGIVKSTMIYSLSFIKNESLLTEILALSFKCPIMLKSCGNGWIKSGTAIEEGKFLWQKKILADHCALPTPKVLS